MSDVNLLDREFYAGDPHPALARLRRDDPVYRDPHTGLWGLLLHEDVVWAERNRDVFSSAGGSRPRSIPQPSMIDSDDPLHARRRRLVDRGFAPSRVASYEDRIRSIVTRLIDEVAPRGECDVVRDLAAPLPMTVIADMLGVGSADHAQLQRWSDEMLAGADGPENATEDVMRAFGEFYIYINSIVEARRRAPRNDLISILVHAEIDGERLSADELLGEALLLLIGGNETTRNVIAGGIEALARNPAQRRALEQDPAGIPAAVEECLRWVTPIINMARTASRDVELRGRTIRAGEQVLLMYTSANRDGRVFERPEEFAVARDPNPHLAFGFGPHYCLGASLSRLEIRVMLEEVLRRLPGLEIAEPLAEVRRSRSSFIRGIVSLPAVFPPGSCAPGDPRA